MNEYEIKVNFNNNSIFSTLKNLVKNDYNSTTLTFTFDRKGSRILFKLLYPDGEFYANKNKPHGGAVYKANGVADFTPDSGLKYCSNVSDNFTNGWAGDNRPIDCVRIYYYTPDDIINKSGYQRAKYRINSLPWVFDVEKCPNGDDLLGTRDKNSEE